MTSKTIVSSLGNNEYRIEFPQPIRFDMNFFLLAGTHKIKVLSSGESKDMVIGVEGEKETLLDWLRSLEGIDEDSLKSYEDAMTE